MKKRRVVSTIILVIIICLILFNSLAPKIKNPRIYSACPSKLVSKLFNIDAIGITLPPVGIWICPEYFENRQVITHELVHWEQYTRFGPVGFYLQYVTAWVYSGFNYDSIWMETEAYSKEQN